MTLPTRTSPRKLLPRPDRRASILDAAAAAFARSGFAATSMAAVAEQAGVTRVLLYRHFDSKDALYRAVLDEVLGSLKRRWVESTAGDSSSAAVRIHLAVARANPDGYRLLWHHAETESAFADYAHEVRRLLAAVADERVGPTIAPTLREWAMTTLVATIVEATLAWLEHGHPDHDEDYVRAATAGMVRLVEGWAEAGHE